MRHFLFLALALTACAETTVKDHSPQPADTAALEPVPGKYSPLDVKGANPKMEEFVKSEVFPCRQTVFHTKPNTSIAVYVKDALGEELKAAGKYALGGDKITINVVTMIPRVDATRGAWRLEFDYILKLRTYRVRTITPFAVAKEDKVACGNAANSLSRALNENFRAFFERMPK